MSFLIPIKKEIKKSNNKNKKIITYNLKFMDTTRHNNRALSTLVDNLSELFMCILYVDHVGLKKVNFYKN